MIWGDAIVGDARKVHLLHVKMVDGTNAPHFFLSGRELIVTKKGNRNGGSIVMYALVLALALDGTNDIVALTGDMDGVDGAVKIVGTIVNPKRFSRSGSTQATTALKNNDAYGLNRSTIRSSRAQSIPMPIIFARPSE